MRRGAEEGSGEVSYSSVLEHDPEAAELIRYERMLMREAGDGGSGDEGDEGGVDFNSIVNSVVLYYHQDKDRVLAWPWRRFWCDVGDMLRRERMSKERMERERQEAERRRLLEGQGAGRQMAY